MPFRWFRAFVFTQIVEVPIYRRAFGCGFWEAFGASTLTHPVVWMLNAINPWHVAWGWRALALETFAWLAEAAYFHWLFGRPRAVRWSLAANALSFSLGLACWYAFGFP